MNFACVLKSGGDFRPDHVALLADGILKHNPDASITCLTDMDVEHDAVRVVPLKHRWQGWWSKMELFRPGLLTGAVVYMDLDTVVIGRIDLEIEPFMMLKAVYRTNDVGSGIMAWREPPTHIYEKFASNPARWMAIYRTSARWGDQAFIRDNLGYKPALLDRQFRSYKVHCRPQVPAGTSVVYFHGRPRPWQVILNHG